MIMEELGEMQKYKVNVIKIKELMEKRLKEYNEDIPDKNKNTIASMLKDQTEVKLSYTTYTDIIKKGEATENSIKALMKLFDCNREDIILEEIIDPIESEQLSKLRKNMKNTDQFILDVFFELSKQVSSTDPIEYFEDVNCIGYKKIEEGKYRIAVPANGEWPCENYTVDAYGQEGSKQWKNQMLTNIDLKLHKTLDTIEDKLDQNKKEENKKLIAKYDKLIAGILKRPLREVKETVRFPNPKVKREVNKSLWELLEKIKKIKQRTIEYIRYDNGEYLVTLPFDEDDCKELGCEEYPLQLTCFLEHVESSGNFESALTNSIIDQLCSEYLESGENDELIKIVEEKIEDLDSFQFKECDPDAYELTEEETKNICKAYQMLLYLMEKQGKVSQSEKNKLVKDIDYAEQKFKEFGIPSPFGKIK